MVDRYKFELELEKIAEKFYLNAATSGGVSRGGNSKDNEDYFKYVNIQLRESLNCQRLILSKGECPDSGLFGDFKYKIKDKIDWDSVKNKLNIVLEVEAPNSEKRYIEIPVSSISFPKLLNSKSKITLFMNDLLFFEDIFGIEFKASKNKSTKAISVASMNSTCPSDTKIASINAKMIHSLDSKMKNNFEAKNINFKSMKVELKIRFSMYYFIVNDEKVDSKSHIRYVLLCRGKFFGLSTSEELAQKLSKELKPTDIKLDLNLYRVKLRFRPFFESRKIQSNGYGLYTSWEPRIPSAIAEHEAREQLLNEIEKIQQNVTDKKEVVVKPKDLKEEDNVIYLNLNERRIRQRSAA